MEITFVLNSTIKSTQTQTQTYMEYGDNCQFDPFWIFTFAFIRCLFHILLFIDSCGMSLWR